MDDDLANLTRQELIAEVMRLRVGIRAHRDSSGHDLCWHHPQLWNLLPEPIPKDLAVPNWPQFLRGCIKYRESLDRELPDAPRTDAEFDKRCKDAEFQPAALSTSACAARRKSSAKSGSRTFLASTMRP